MDKDILIKAIKIIMKACNIKISDLTSNVRSNSNYILTKSDLNENNFQKPKLENEDDTFGHNEHFNQEDFLTRYKDSDIKLDSANSLIKEPINRTNPVDMEIDPSLVDDNF